MSKQREWYPTRKQLRVLHRALEIACGKIIDRPDYLSPSNSRLLDAFYSLMHEMPSGKKARP